MKYYNLFNESFKNMYKLNDASELSHDDSLEEGYLTNWKNTLQRILEVEFGQTTDVNGGKRSFLTPKGNFIPTDAADGPDLYAPHYAVDNWIGNFVFNFLGKNQDYKNYTEEEKEDYRLRFHITDEDVMEIYNNVDWDTVGWENGGSPLLEKELNYIRLNGDEEYYIVLPLKNLTDAQYELLRVWLDKYYTEKNNQIYIEGQDPVDGQLYKPEETTVDEIIKKVRRFYATGDLIEDVNDDDLKSLNFSFDVEPFYTNGKYSGFKLVINGLKQKTKLAKFIKHGGDKTRYFNYKDKWSIEYDATSKVFTALIPETYQADKKSKGVLWTPFRLREEDVISILDIDIEKLRKLYTARHFRVEEDVNDKEEFEVSDEPAELATLSPEEAKSQCIKLFADRLPNRSIVIGNLVYQIKDGFTARDEDGELQSIENGIFSVYEFVNKKIIGHATKAETCQEVDKIGTVPYTYFCFGGGKKRHEFKSCRDLLSRLDNTFNWRAFSTRYGDLTDVGEEIVSMWHRAFNNVHESILKEEDVADEDDLEVSDEPVELETASKSERQRQCIQFFADKIPGEKIVRDNIIYQIRDYFNAADLSGNMQPITHGIFLIFVFENKTITVHTVSAEECPKIDKIGTVPYTYFCRSGHPFSDASEFLEVLEQNFRWKVFMTGSVFIFEMTSVGSSFVEMWNNAFNVTNESILKEDGEEELEVSDEPVELAVINTEEAKRQCIKLFADMLPGKSIIKDNLVYQIKDDFSAKNESGDPEPINSGIFLIYKFDGASIVLCVTKAETCREIDKIGTVPYTYFCLSGKSFILPNMRGFLSTLEFNFSWGVFMDDPFGKTTHQANTIIELWNKLFGEIEIDESILKESAGDIKLRKFLFAKTPKNNHKFPKQEKYYNNDLGGYLITWDYKFNTVTRDSEDEDWAHTEAKKSLPLEMQNILTSGEGSAWGREDYHENYVRLFISDGVSEKDAKLIRKILSRGK